MINAGFNPLQEIARKTGKSISELKEEMSKGAISAQMVQEAFISATSAGGKFYGMSEAASKTINGQISMMEDAMDAAFNELGTKSEGIIMGSIQTITKLIENYEKVGKAIITLAGTYGTYRAAVILTTAAEKAQALARLAQIKHTTMLELATGALTKKMKAFNAVMKLNPYALAAAALVGIGGAIWTATEGNRELKKSIEETSEGIIKEVNNVNSLAAKLQDSNTSEAERLELLKQLKEINPDIVKGIDDEAKSLANLQENVDAYNAQKNIELAINQSDEKLEFEKSKKTVSELEDKKKDLEAEITNMMVDVSKKAREALMNGKFSPIAADYIDKVLDDATATVEEKLTKLKNIHLFEGASTPDIRMMQKITSDRKNALGEYKVYTRSLVAAQEEFANKTKALQERISSSVEIAHLSSEQAKQMNFNLAYLYDGAKTDDTTTGGSTSTTPQVKYQEDAGKTWEQASKDALSGYREAKKALDAAKKEGKTLADLKTLQDDLEKKKQKLLYYNPNALKTGSGNKQHAAQKELTQKRNEIALERKAQDAEHNMKMSGIKAIADDEEREREQRKLENEKSIRDIERRKEDYIETLTKAEVDKQVAAKKKNIDVNAIRESVSDSQVVKNFDIEKANVKKAQENEDAKREREKLDAQRKAWQDYYIEYGAYQEKRLYLAQQYDDKIAMAEKKGLEGEVASLKAEKDRVLDELEKGMNAQYQNIFKDPTKMSLGTVRDAIKLAREEIKKITSKGVLNDEDLQNLKILQDALDRLREQEENSPFIGWTDGVDGLVDKLNLILRLRREIEEAKETGNKDAQREAEEELSLAKDAIMKNLIGTGMDAFVSGIHQAANAMKEIASIAGDIKLEQTANALNAAGSFISSVGMGAATGGWIGAIVGGAVSLIETIIGAISDFAVATAINKKAFEDYQNAIENIATNWEKDKFESVFGTSAWGAFYELGQSIEKATERWRKLNEEAFITNEYLQHMEGQIDTSWISVNNTGINGVDGVNLNNDLAGLTNPYLSGNNKDVTHVLGEAVIKARGKNKKEYSGTLNTIFPDLFDEYGRLKLDKIEEAKAALETLQGMKLRDDQGVSLLEQAIEAGEKLLELQEELKAAAKDFMGEIGNSIGNAIVDGILKGEDALANFADVAAGIIDQLARSAASSWMIDNYLKNFDDQMSYAFATGDVEGAIRVVGNIVNGLPAVLEAGTEFTKQLLDSTKGTEYDVYEYSKEQQQQQASQKGYAALSEETGSELSGRALAQYESNLRIEASQREQTASIIEIKAAVLESMSQQNAIKNVADDCRRILAETQVDVRAILNNTEAMLKPIKNLSDKMNSWDSKIMSL